MVTIHPFGYLGVLAAFSWIWYFVTTEILSVGNPVVPGPFLVSALVVYCLPCFFGADN